MIRASAISILFLGFLTRAHGQEPGTRVQFLELPAFNQRQDPKWGAVLTDIVNHEAPGDSNPYGSLVTKAHETTHGINSWIRNKMTGGTVTFVLAIGAGSGDPLGDGESERLLRSRVARESFVRANGFYVLQDRAVRIKEPGILKQHVVPHVPASLRGPRYSLYVVGQTAWDDTPLYLWDEWTAYVNGALAGVDLVESGLWSYPWQDAMFGPLEFSVYALATAMAVKQRDPAYFDSNLQFREYLAYNARRAMEVYGRGHLLPAFTYAAQEQYLERLRTSADAAAMREFTRSLFGTAWTMDVFGF